MNKAILYIGSLANWCNSRRRFEALKAINPDTEAINTDGYLLPKIISGFQHHMNIGPGITLLNNRIRKVVKNKKPAIILVDNKSYLSRKTLLFIKSIDANLTIVNLLTDDPFGKFTNSWPLIKRTAYLYGLFFVQRKTNIEELKALGARTVKLCYRSFDPAFNRPLKLEAADISEFKTKVGFVGTYEESRASYIAFLIENGISVTVTGNDWPNKSYWEIIKPYYKGPSIYGDAYIKTINGMDIALHFLRQGNRDEQDSRTFEIPACKVFMLAEASDVHSELFEQNEEAVYFASKEELLEKVKYYLSNDRERERIALNGYNKCFSAGYDHESRMKEVLKTIVELNNN